MIHRMLIAAAMLGTSPVAAAAGNDCRIDALDIQPDNVTAAYDPFDVAPVSEEFRIDVRTRDCPSNRNLFLSLGSNDPSSYDGRTIRLLGGSGEVLIARLSDRSSAQGSRPNDSFNVKEGLTPLYLLIDSAQVVSPGTYRASMQAYAMLNQGNNTPRIGQPFDLSVTVAPAVGLAAASGSELNLGELGDQDRAVSNVTFDAYANVAYELNLSSDNDFQLRRANDSSRGIDYRPVVDDAVVPSGQARVDYPTPKGEANRRRHQLNVVVPSVGNAPAGSYRDYLTVTIKPKFGG